MKLQAISQNIAVSNKTNNTKKQQILNNNHVMSNSIAKNSVSELMGRTQVNFGNKRYFPPNNQYDFFQEFLLSDGSKGNIGYNSRTGEMTWYTQDKRNKNSVETNFNPSTSTKTEKYYNANGREKEVVTTSDNIFTTIKDDGGFVVYSQVEDFEGNANIERTEFSRGRKVLEEIHPNMKPITRVIDLKTNTEVTEGPLVEDEVTDENGNKKLYNIVTGQIYKTTENTRDGYIIKEFCRSTGIISAKTVKRRDTLTTTTYGATGLAVLRRTTDKNGNETVIEFGRDGHTEISKTEYLYDSDGNVEVELHYHPNTKLVDWAVEYDYFENKRSVFKYLEDPNVTNFSKTYQNQELLEECEYYIDENDSRRKQHQVTYDGNTTYKDDFANNSKNTLKNRVIEINGIFSKSEKYDPITGKLLETTAIHPRKPGYLVNTHFAQNGKKSQRDILNPRNIVIQTTFYYPDGKPHVHRFFAGDRSYMEITLNKKGEETSRYEYWQDGTPKQ